MISRSEPLRRRNIRRGFHTVCLRGNAYLGRSAPRGAERPVMHSAAERRNEDKKLDPSVATLPQDDMPNLPSLDNPRFVRYHNAQQVNLLLSNESNCYHLVYLRRQESIEMSAFRGSCADTW